MDKELGKKLISLTEATKGTPYSQEYLSLLARRGKLFSKKIGRNWYTTPEAIAHYIAQQKKSLADALRTKQVIEEALPGEFKSVKVVPPSSGETLSPLSVKTFTPEATRKTVQATQGVMTAPSALFRSVLKYAFRRRVQGGKTMALLSDFIHVFFSEQRKIFAKEFVKQALIVAAIVLAFFGFGLRGTNFFTENVLGIYDLSTRIWDMTNFASGTFASV